MNHAAGTRKPESFGTRRWSGFRKVHAYITRLHTLLSMLLFKRKPKYQEYFQPFLVGFLGKDLASTLQQHCIRRAGLWRRISLSMQVARPWSHVLRLGWVRVRQVTIG